MLQETVCNEYAGIQVTQVYQFKHTAQCEISPVLPTVVSFSHLLFSFTRSPTTDTFSRQRAPVSLCCIHVTWEHQTELTALRNRSTVFMHSKSPEAVKHHNGRLLWSFCLSRGFLCGFFILKYMVLIEMCFTGNQTFYCHKKCFFVVCLMYPDVAIG